MKTFSRIPKRSAKKAKADREWAKVVKECVKERGEYCEICLILWMNPEGHHKLARSQGGQNTKENCLLLCRNCHDFVHRNPLQAEANGWIITRRNND